MTNKDFMDTVVNPRLNHCKSLLNSKNEEYAKDDDRFHNFKKTGIVRNISPIDALNGMFNKHLISLIDILDNAVKGILPTQKILDEKISDNINYLLLFEGLVTEERRKK